MGNVALLNGSSEWTEERWLDTPRTMHQGISPSSPTSMPPKNTTTTTTTTLPGPYQGGSYLPWGEVALLSLHSIMHSTSSLSTTGASWPRSTATAPWTSSVRCCAARLTSSNRRSKQLKWSSASAKGGSKPPERTAKTTTYDWVKPGPIRSKTGAEQTWYARTNKLDMDEGIHSDEEGGVTS